jgi:hypothetical protein
MFLRSLVGLFPVQCVVSSICKVTATVETLDRTLSRTHFGKTTVLSLDRPWNKSKTFRVHTMRAYGGRDI